ncbi:L-ascorbate metabolism protein UlaG, beta-lactamase superfamily [Halogranum gelatinilyticum]|uniref:L-ascorbate metabolism protein UlaG, beta-lactamase superfamily n=1 Tax=Halogranum gelatinilyticum TaxID=660521 RepID=A0A1G9W5C9_9EURY|nr:MBL fold metallo-hydrolase [Halogranum gelatinilyticum]SDM79416.1 L-ascorbate metabolism protein UlaG, beta-lactamase superfamily [Halogranum gelatinilyticum]
MTIKHDGLSVTWLGYATVRIETADGFVAYLDPGRYGVLDDYYARDGDLVCVTHNHHYDSDGIEKVAKEDATVVAYEGVDADDIDRDVKPVGDLPYEVVRVEEEDHVTVGEVDQVDVWSLPAYNEPDGPHVDANGDPHHPRGLGCAFLLSIGGRTVFWPGDSDALPGFEELEVSLFLANIGGSVVMDRHEAADLASALDPDLVLPIHYNTFDLLAADGGAFAADVAKRGIPVVLDEQSANQ